MNEKRLHMNRMGLVDFWCYHDEEFHFENGHMLLRGSNGSGKSVTMQSFIPLLLDGNKSSERLDPFGTRSRKMETYLIDENSERQERIGYLYLEFKKEDEEHYETIGMGLHARKNKPLKTWYFVIEDNRRVNIDFRLMEGNLSLTEKQLRNILGNQVISSQGEYMQRVNQTLFGFESIDEYKDAISLLLQLRSPKLSNSLSPAKLNEILSKSLQPLSDEDLRPMTEAMTSMDDLQDQLDDLKQSLSASQTLEKAYDLYNKAQLFDKWKKYNSHEQEYQDIQKEIFKIDADKKQASQSIQEQKSVLSKKQVSYEIKKNEYQSLKNSDVEKWVETIQELQKAIEIDSKTLNKKQMNYDQKDNAYQESKKHLDDFNDKSYISYKKAKNSIQILDDLNTSMNLSEHIALKQCFENHETNYNFNYTRDVLVQELNKVTQGIQDWNRYHEISKRKDFYVNKKTELTDHIDHIQMEIEKAEEVYKQVIEEYQDNFHHYHQQNRYIHFSDEEFEQLREYLIAYENTKHYYPIQQLVTGIYQEEKNKLYQVTIDLKNELSKSNQQLLEVKEEYEQWLNKEDIEPDISIGSMNNRKYLDQQHIPYIPLYKLLEFSNCLTKQQKDRIEELFVQMNLLDALIIETKYTGHIEQIPNGCTDYYLWTRVELQKLESFEIKQLDNEDDMFELLQALHIEFDEHFIIKKRYFKSGVIEGNVSCLENAQYIGYQQRLKTKEIMIEQLSTQMNMYQKQIDELKQKLSFNSKQEDILENELKKFKDEKEIKEILENILKLNQQTQFYQNQVDEVDVQINKIQLQLNDLYLNVQKMAEILSLKVDYSDFIDYRDHIQNYQNNFFEFKDEYEKYIHYLELKSLEEEKISDYEFDLDNIKIELSDLNQRIEINIGKKESLQDQLDQADYHDLSTYIETLQKDISNLENDCKQIEKDIVVLENEIKHYNRTLNDLQKTYEEKEKIVKIYKEIFEEELNLKLIPHESINNQKDFIQKILRDLAQKKSLSDYQTQLQRVYFEQMTYLTQYNVLQENRQPTHIVEDISSRIILKAKYLGKNISFLQLIEQLKNNIETQELLIVEEDKHIFEDILVNNISKKIRDSIHSSKRWVEMIQAYIHDMNTSSGLQLQLKWKSKKAINADELDSQELVELLEMDYYVLKEPDRKKISNHFRKKIQTARLMSREENITTSFHQLMKDVLDYRQWFDFTIYAKKPNENRKELTAHVFFSYSGGEKAISMYIPLFSAVAAKFASARNDAPLIIALDEAFAGVDEKNIDNMFKLITKFEFDYIMNSQVLWGDYPSCPSLAIYELFRPNNAPFVTIVSYIWNGFQKRLVV